MLLSEGASECFEGWDVVRILHMGWHSDCFDLVSCFEIEVIFIAPGLFSCESLSLVVCVCSGADDASLVYLTRLLDRKFWRSGKLTMGYYWSNNNVPLFRKILRKILGSFGGGIELFVEFSWASLI